LLQAEIKVVYVTHMYDLADGFRRQKMDMTLFLRAEREADGRRTFRVGVGEPLRTSYGPDVYREIFASNQTPAAIGADLPAKVD
jgi:hypothetical protein